jgi:tellurite resistance protein
MMLTLEETRAVLTVALLAAFSDGLKDDREREAVKRVADALGPDAGFDLPGLYRDVLLAKPDLAKVAAELQSPESRQLAYEMAVGVCDADGAQGPAEKQFLAKLAEALSLPAAAASATSARADEVAEAAFAPTEAPAATASAPVSGTVMGKANI